MEAVGQFFGNSTVQVILGILIALFLGREHGRKMWLYLRRNAHKARVDIAVQWLGLIAVSVTAFHLLYFRYSSYLNALAAICILYVMYCFWVMISRTANINILAWIGWDILDNHVHSRQMWKRVQYRAIYYNRGISADTELYDAARNPFHVIVLDAERLAAINADSTGNIARLPKSVRTRYAKTELVDSILESNLSWLTDEVLDYGVPVRFGFNEVLYSEDMNTFLIRNGMQRSLSQMRLKELNDVIKARGRKLRICMWDWYLPTLSTLLCAYSTDDSAPFLLSEVYAMNGDSVNRVATAIIDDMTLLKEKITLLREAKDLEGFLSSKKKNEVDVIIGFGSIGVSTSSASLCAFIPREGVLAWIEFASLLETEGKNPIALRTITDLILSMDTQTHLLTSMAPIGLPATKEAFESCRRDQHLIMQTANQLRDKKVPLILRRLPNGPASTDPGAGSLQETWEAAWESMRQIIEDRP